MQRLPFALRCPCKTFDWISIWNYSEIFSLNTKQQDEATSRKGRNIVATLRQVANLINICICPNRIMPSAVAALPACPGLARAERVAFTACHKLSRVSSNWHYPPEAVDSRTGIYLAALRIRHVFVSGKERGRERERESVCVISQIDTIQTAIKKQKVSWKSFHFFTRLKGGPIGN